MRDRFEKILNQHGVYGEDVVEILFAVSDMLELSADDLEKNEPYAVITIKRLREAAHDVWELGIDL